MNTTSTPQEEKLIDIAPHEDKLRAPLHKQDPCRICGSIWYLSDGRLQYHREQKKANERWKFPTSCPDCRSLSQAKAMEFRKSQCSTNKMEFDTKSDAENYEKTNRVKYGIGEQYAYYCAQCHNYHLTSNKPTDTSSGALASPLGRAVASAPSAPAPVATPAAPAPAGESRELAACRMYRDGALTRDICSALKVAAPTLYQWLKKHNIPTRTSGAGHPANTSSPFKEPVDLDEEEERLTAQLEEVKRKKRLLEEARRLRVELVGTTAFRIMKEGEHATLSLDELLPLIDQLMSLVPKPTPQTEQQVEPVLEAF